MRDFFSFAVGDVRIFLGAASVVFVRAREPINIEISMVNSPYARQNERTQWSGVMQLSLCEQLPNSREKVPKHRNKYVVKHSKLSTKNGTVRGALTRCENVISLFACYVRVLLHACANPCQCQFASHTLANERSAQIVK